jgi:hypothetical protein
MAVSIYIALTVKPSSSLSLMAKAPRNEKKSCARGSSTRKPHSRAVVSQRSRCRKLEDIETSCRKSKQTKKTAVGDTAAVPSLCGGPLLAANFDEIEWETMYPHFVEEAVLIFQNVRTNKIFNVLYVCCNSF